MNNETANSYQRRILDGEDCPSCGGIWVLDHPEPDKIGNKDLAHDVQCPLIAWLDRSVLFNQLLNSVMIEFSDLGVRFDADAQTITVGDRYHVAVTALTEVVAEEVPER